MRQKVIGACLGTAIGDALGMPAEGKNPEAITRLYNKIESYRIPRSSKDGRPFHHNLTRGMWTDDTQLMLAIGESIADSGCIDYEDIAYRHTVFYHEKRGWGGSTKKAVESIMDGVPWYNSGVDGASGNGPPMKIAPIGVLYGIGKLNDFELVSVCLNISRMTHNDPRPAIAAILQAQIIGSGISGGPIVALDSLQKMATTARKFEDLLGYRRPCISVNIREAIKLALRKEDIDLRKEIGNGPFVVESFPFTCAMILKYWNDPKKCMERIIAMGGDADTNAAMAGAVLGGTHGYGWFPRKWIRGLEDRQRIVNMAKGLLALRSEQG